MAGPPKKRDWSEAESVRRTVQDTGRVTLAIHIFYRADATTGPTRLGAVRVA